MTPRGDTARLRDPRRRLPAVLVVLAIVVGACGPAAAPESLGLALPGSSAPAPVPTDADTVRGVRDVEGLQAVLDEIATGFRTADPALVEPHLYDPDSSFGKRWVARARNMAGLPLATYELAVDESLPDLSTETVRDRYPELTQVVYVVERIAIDGFDDTPAAEDMFLTVTRDGDGWKVAADTDAERLGLVTVDHLWDHGPVEVTVDGPLMAIHHPDGPAVGPLLDDATAALDQASERWPLAWPRRVPILVPRDEDELADLLHVTFDLSSFVAFATATSTGTLGDYALTGSRIVLNPERFLDRSTETRRRILVHELVHVATRPVAGPQIPSWLDEGVAQALGERRSTTGTVLVDALATEEVGLPTDGQFTVGGRDRIFLSYQLAWSFLEHLRQRHGDTAVARFYAAAGEGAIGEPGTEAFHVDRAAREVFGAGLDELVTGWRAAR